MTEPKRRGRPVTTGTTPTRTMRLGPIYDRARTIAEQRGETITAVIERKLTEYIQEDTMTTYTVEIQASNADGTIWQALAPAETVESDGTADEVARDTAQNQNVAEGGTWRVQVWAGDLTDGEPAGEYYAEDTTTTDADRIATRNAIIAEWEQQAKPHNERIETLYDDVELAMAGAALDAIRKAAADRLEPLGYRIHTGMTDTIIDERTTNGMLAIIARAERDRADAEHDAVMHAADRDDAIRQAIAADVPVTQIAEAAGLKPASVDQIRDDRR